MTIKPMPGGGNAISWEPGDEIDWTTPNVGDGIDDEYCGNCGLDFPGCGCPRDCPACQETGIYCGHLNPPPGRLAGDEEWDDEPCDHICDEECEDYQGFSRCTHSHCFNCGGCGCPGYCDDHQTYNLRPSETGGELWPSLSCCWPSPASSPGSTA